MASRPLKPCLKSGCSALTRDGYCDKHKHLAKSRRSESSAWHWMYGTPEWKPLRVQHLLDEPFCRHCAAKNIRTRATVVDHIVPHRGDWALFLDPSNLQSLCKYHHDVKTLAERRAREMQRQK